MQWPFLESCVEEGSLEPIDLFFAKSLLGRTDCVREDAAAFLALMMMHYRAGNLCVDVQELSKSDQALDLLALQGAVQLPQQICEEVHGDELMPLKPVCRHNERYYFQKNWVFETQFLQHCRRLLQSQVALCHTVVSEPVLNREQQGAICLALQSSLSLIIGGPGTGKTFTAKHLVKQYLKGLSTEKRKTAQIILAAPTGKAVTHLEKQISCVLDESEKKQLRSGTLHGLLQMREDGTQKTEAVLLADLIIVDECSMIDAKMGALLLGAVPSGTRVVLIGDKEQLPAVEAGCFFADLIDGGCPATRLKQSRRVENEDLGALGQAICQGEVGERLTPFLVADEAPILERARMCYPSFFSTPPPAEELLAQMESFRILSCLRQGPLGVDAVNQTLLRAFQSRLPDQGWWAIPIIITRNDYSSELYNGDAGVWVKKIDPSEKKLRVSGEDYALFPEKEPVPALCLPAFEMAYCLSVHKSQGSEYDSVALLVPEGSDRFGREILYTAVTRARKELVVYAQPGMIEKMLKKTSRKVSGLAQRLSPKG